MLGEVYQSFAEIAEKYPEIKPNLEKCPHQMFSSVDFITVSSYQAVE